MKKILYISILTVLCSCGADYNSSPEVVVNTIFSAARQNNISILKNLCHPDVFNDGPTRRICNLEKYPTRVNEFIELFQNGSIDKNLVTVIDNDLASVPIIFGPNSDMDGVMYLVKFEGKWYLAGF